jgi:tRNA (guanine-N1)-methyltransferase
MGNKKLKVPKVLLSGDHKKIEKWREKNQKNNLLDNKYS